MRWGRKQRATGEVRPDPIPAAGACVVSENVWDGTGRVRWLVREPSIADADNGWRIWSELDDEAYLDDPDNLRVADFNDICAIEPLLVAVYDFPVGSDLVVVDDADGKRLVRADTGENIPPEVYYVPPRPGDREA